MLDIVLIGLSHKTAPVELRECIALDSDESQLALGSFKSHPAIGEVVLFSTCNRVEILMTSPDPPAAISAAKSYLADSKQIQLTQKKLTSNSLGLTVTNIKNITNLQRMTKKTSST